MQELFKQFTSYNHRKTISANSTASKGLQGCPIQSSDRLLNFRYKMARQALHNLTLAEEGRIAEMDLVGVPLS